MIISSGYILSSENGSNSEDIPTGMLSWSQWQSIAGWEDYSASDYTPDQNIVNQIDSITKQRDICFIIFTASWCSDSRSETPKIYKSLTLSNISLEAITLYGVDREKKEPTEAYLEYDLERVPTLIIVENEAVIGTIVEYPNSSWEQDILDILLTP